MCRADCAGPLLPGSSTEKKKLVVEPTLELLKMREELQKLREESKCWKEVCVCVRT